LFLPAWPSQDLLSVSQASIVRLEEGRHSKPCHPEIAAWSNSVVTIFDKLQVKPKKIGDNIIA